MARSCGTCRDRRISCDRALPGCTQCAKGNRACKGYGVRLSWPKRNDAKRAMVGRASRQSAARQASRPYLVNATTWDIMMHQYLVGSLPDNYAHLFVDFGPMPFSQKIFDDGDAELLEYFQHAATKSLATLSQDPTELGTMLMRLAYTSNTPSALAVRHAILCLASVHRYGLQSQAMSHKIASIRSLKLASTNEIGGTEATQHVAAGMLLCTIEIDKASCTSGQWRWYVTGVKRLLNAICPARCEEDGIVKALMAWAQYHDVLARFSSLHWRHNIIAQAFPTDPNIMAKWCHRPHLREEVDDPTPVLNSTPSFLNSLLVLFAKGCDVLSTIMTKDSPGVLDVDSESPESLQNIISELKALLFDTDPDTTTPTIHLFHLACVIYLSRTSPAHSNHETENETSLLIYRAFSIMSTLPACERQFPLAILGFEARTDDERGLIMDLVARTEKKVSSRSLFLTATLVKRVWVQDDLAGGQLDYGRKLSAILGVCGILPPFV
ncbi:fungal-specific transcription factor domain-containing protein [Aspergillus crustosus]